MIFKNICDIDTQFIDDSKNLFEFINSFQKINFNFNELLINIRKNKTKMTKVLFLLNININLFYELYEIINNESKYSDRIITYCIEYYLILILHVKNNLNNWKILQTLCLCCSPYKSIYNQFLRWSNKNLFYNAYDNNITNNNISINNLQIIDASSCYNKYGSENVTINPEYKKKKVTKVSLLCDENKIITAVSLFDVKTTSKIYKNKNIKTFVHDSKTIQKTVNNVNNLIHITKIIGDGGYKTQDLIKQNNKKIPIITPNRINQKNNLINNKEKNYLKKRYKIENVLCSIKMNNERIFLRKDRKKKHFLSWFYIACLDHNINILKKIKK